MTLSPSSADAHVRLAAAFEYAGRPRAALESLARAVELDPLHFILHIRTCLVRQNLGQYEQAKQACNRSLELRPDLPNAHWGLALIALSHGDLAAAAKGYRAALAQNPERVDLSIELAYVDLDVGLLDAARDRFEQAIGSSPAGQPYARVHKSAWYVARRDSRGLAKHLGDIALEEVTDSDLAVDLALFWLLSGDLQRVRRFAQHGIDLTAAPESLRNPYRIRWGRSSQLTLALVAVRSGETAAAEQRLAALVRHLDELEREGHVWHGLEYLRASAHALRGETREALSALERAYRLGWRRAWWMRADPAFTALRGETAFRELIARIEADVARQRSAAIGSITPPQAE